MEKRLKRRIQENFPTEIINKEIVILDIPNKYKFMDEVLMEDIKTKVDHYLNSLYTFRIIYYPLP